MFKKKSFSRIFIVLLILVFMLTISPLQEVNAAGIRYAKPSASGTGKCTSWANACSLQTALYGSVSGDEIWVAKGTYKPTSGTNRIASFLLENGVAIYGGFAGTETLLSQRHPATNVTILSGDIGGAGHNDNSYHVVTAIDNDATAVLDGFTITGGNADDNTDTNYEGGGMLSLSSSPTLTDVTFSNNYASWGGGIYNEDGSPTLTGVTFSANTADVGGGIYNYEDTSDVTLKDVTFSQNHASVDGGGMYNTEGGNGTLNNVTFSGNTANDGSGGGMYVDYGQFTISDVTFSNNSATGSGGGIYIEYSTSTTLTDGIFSDNSADYGGGLLGDNYCYDYDYDNNYCMGASYSFVTLADVTFNDNHATSDGGGIYDDGVFTLTGVTFNGNSAGTEGGGMDNEENLDLSDGTFSANTSDEGGGLYNEGFTTDLSNVTFSGNSAASSGGGLYNFLTSEDIGLSMTNITFSGNSANQGGGIYNFEGSPSIDDSILWGNTAGGGGAQIYNDDGSATSAITYSDVQGGCPAGSTCSNDIDLNPLLGSLGDYGGGTQVFPLLPGSPAIGTGENATCAFYDQRGIKRPQGTHCDMGAFESQGFNLTITGGNNQFALINTAFAAPLALSVKSAYGEPVNGGKITFTPPSSGASAVLSSKQVTIAGGAASVTAIANGVLGAYTVTAKASGVASPVAFHLTNSLTLPPVPFGKISPANGITGQPNNPILKWATSSNATSYEYCLGTAACTAASTWTSTGSATSKALSSLIPGVKYYWQVRARIGSLLTYADGSLSTAWTFTVLPLPGAFNKSSPANAATNQPNNLTLKWAASTGTTSYEYCLGTATCTAASTWTSTGTATSKALSGLKSYKTYYWQVRAVNSSGTTYANGGTVWSFKTALLSVSFQSVGTYDGWVLESKVGSAAGGSLDAASQILVLGDDKLNRQYRDILSFNTASLPDTVVITSVTLKVMQQSIVGTNPFSTLGALNVDIRKPYFGTSVGLVAGDFQAAAGKSGAGTFSATPVSGWYTATLGSSANSNVNLSGTTQFRLRFATASNKNGVADTVNLFSGNASTAADRPVLIIQYYVP